MREIKFRAWNKEEKVFYFDVQNVCRKRIIGDSMCESFEQVCNSWDFEVNQYTGLKDKNGKEIYEGDILSGIKKKKIEVKYHGSSFGYFNEKFKSLYTKEKYIEFVPFNICDLSDLELKGNIYENPELLKG